MIFKPLIFENLKKKDPSFYINQILGSKYFLTIYKRIFQNFEHGIWYNLVHKNGE